MAARPPPALRRCTRAPHGDRRDLRGCGVPSGARAAGRRGAGGTPDRSWPGWCGWMRAGHHRRAERPGRVRDAKPRGVPRVRRAQPPPAVRARSRGSRRACGRAARGRRHRPSPPRRAGPACTPRAAAASRRRGRPRPAPSSARRPSGSRVIGSTPRYTGVARCQLRRSSCSHSARRRACVPASRNGKRTAFLSL